MKPDGSIRICGDYKLTINRAAKPDVYPLPRVEDLLATLAGGKSCSKLDLAQAHQQIPLDESSKPYVTINTHKGLYRYNRQLPLLYFRGTWTTSCRHTTCVRLLGWHLIDGKQWGRTFGNFGQGLDKAWNSWRKTSVFISWLSGAQQKDCNQQKTKSELSRKHQHPPTFHNYVHFLGQVNYYGKFLSNLASTLAPLLQKDKHWLWGEAQKEPFDGAKKPALLE